MFSAIGMFFIVIFSAFAGAGIVFLFALKEISDLRMNVNYKESRLDILNESYSELIDEYNELVDKYNRLLKSKSVNKDKTKKEIVEAIKFAMVHSHPDKGICKNSDEFIRFRKLYKEVS